MTLSKTIMSSLIALPLVFGSFSASANAEKAPGIMGQMAMKVFLKDVTLTDEQKAELKTLRQDNREKLKANIAATKEQRIADREKMTQLVMAEKFDEAAARELVQKMVNLQVDQRLNALKNQHSMYSVLTPEQQAQVKTNLDELKTKLKARLEKNA